MGEGTFPVDWYVSGGISLTAAAINARRRWAADVTMDSPIRRIFPICMLASARLRIQPNISTRRSLPALSPVPRVPTGRTLILTRWRKVAVQNGVGNEPQIDSG